MKVLKKSEASEWYFDTNVDIEDFFNEIGNLE
jgi:hypothetical protein